MKQIILRVLGTLIIMVSGLSVMAQSADDLVKKAIELKDAGKYDEALEYCDKALSKDSKHSWAYNIKGLTYDAKKQYDLAIEAYTEALKIDPKYKQVYTNRGGTYRVKKEYDIAKADLNEALGIDPNYSNARFELGRVAYETKNYDQAIIEFTEAMKLGSTKKTCYWWIADCYYYGKKDYDAAISNYNQMIRLDPKDIDGYRLRGYVYHYGKKDYDKAIADYNTVLTIDPKNHLQYYRRGFAYNSQKLYDLAIQDISKAIELNTKDPSAYLIGRSGIYKTKGDTTSAVADFNEAVRITGKASTVSSRGWFFLRLKWYDKALQDFEKAIEMDPKTWGAFTGKAELFIKKFQYDQAMAEYEKVVKGDPTYSTIYYYKGDLLRLQGYYDASIVNFETYKAKAKLEAVTYHISPLIRMGQWDKAKAEVERYFELYKTSVLDDDKYKFYKQYLSVIVNDIPAEQYELALTNLDKAIRDYTAYSTEDEDSKYDFIDILALKGWVLEKLSRFNEAKEVYEQTLLIHKLQPDIQQAIAGLTKKKETLAVGDKTIPEIQLISPQASRGLQVVGAANQTQVIGKVKDASGIASVTINGKRIDKIEEDGLFTTTLSFKPGANNILITATDKKGNKATKTFLVTGNAVAKKQTEEDIIVPVATSGNAPQYHAIIIAAKDYADSRIQDLENPVKDAAEFKTILETQYTFSSGNIETLYNKSREEIMQSIIQKSNALGENDNLVIFYAGHGIAEKDRFGDVDGYWIPSSAIKGNTATYISTDDIRKSLKRSNSKHILVIADACFSGAFTRELSSDAEVGIQKQYNVPSRKIMASGNLEPVPDNSRFIYYLKKSLKENKQKYLTAKKLFDGFYEAILNNSDTSPQYAAIKNVGDEGGEFVFIKK
jgi:tetratricopeptide (TPR) repeat protein